MAAMDSIGIVIDASDIFRFGERLVRSEPVVGTVLAGALAASGKVIQAAARGRLAAVGAVDSGALSESIMPRIDGQTVIVGSPLIQAAVVEDGRRPGAPPPPEGALLPWMERHNIPPEAEPAIRWTIARRGIPARPFLRGTLAQSARQIERAFEDAGAELLGWAASDRPFVARVVGGAR